jgi:hypothetical protein
MELFDGHTTTTVQSTPSVEWAKAHFLLDNVPRLLFYLVN